MKIIILLVVAMLLLPSLYAQITERERPAGWKQLVKGGRFMDRFLPMKGDSAASSEVWGADYVAKRYTDNGIELPDISFWGGNILQTPDNKYHLFVCGWAENSPKGHMAWPNSTVYHAVSDQLNGPFAIRDTVGKGHNPEAFTLKDGRIVVYVIGGYYIANTVDGPWTYGKFEFDARDRKIIEGLSNLTFARRKDNSFLMVCRGGGVWVSRDGMSPYRQLTDKRVYPAVKGEFEDPVVWRDSLQYHLIVNDWLGRIAWYQRSKDGVHWITEQGEAYMPGVSFHKDGYVEEWFKYERPKVFQDKYGHAIQMNFAVIDTIKWEDHPNDNHSSKNICIPLNGGLQLSVLNKEPVTSSTPFIEVRIKATEGFDPRKEVNVGTLRFGSYNEVNFGRGCRAVKVRKSGKDLIVVFDGKGSGITDEEFAPKLIGQDKGGKLLYGYARLPYVDYNPALLSARRPVYDGENAVLKLEVQNFGLSRSEPVTVEVLGNGQQMARGELKSLLPYESLGLDLKVKDGIRVDETGYEIIFYSNGKVTERNIFD